MEEIQSSHECPIPELSHITQGYGTRDRWEQNKTGEIWMCQFSPGICKDTEGLTQSRAQGHRSGQFKEPISQSFGNSSSAYCRCGATQLSQSYYIARIYKARSWRSSSIFPKCTAMICIFTLHTGKAFTE